MADAVNEHPESQVCLNITSMEVILSAGGGQLHWKQIGRVFRCVEMHPATMPPA